MFNFAIPPDVHGEDAYWDLKTNGKQHQFAAHQDREYRDIEMPRNSPTGFVCAFFTR